MNQMKKSENNDFNKVIEAIRTNNRFFIGTHVFPDGDNIGSVIALKLILERLNKFAYPYCETHIPIFYKWLEGEGDIHHELPKVSVRDFDAIIVLDSGDLKRLGRKFYEWVRDDKTIIVNIDHHITNAGFGDINWVDHTYAASGEQVFEIAKILGVELDLTIATAIFTAIYTDTGRFSYSNTNARTMYYAAELVAAGVVTNEIYRKVYASRSLAALKLEREVLQTLVYDEDYRLAYMTMTLDMVERSGALIEDSEGIIEHVTLFGESVRNFLLFKETSQGELKVSVRSKGEWDASKVAMLFGGGGHRGAGGFAVRGPVNEAISDCIMKIKQAVNSGIVSRD
jgi:phosphoesterase RecJ-like protein